MSPRQLAEALAERLDALIHRPEQQRLALSQWRLVLDSGTSVEVGLKDNRPGGPYDAPNAVTGTRGDVFLRWADGRVSHGSIDRTTLANLNEDLEVWRAAAYEDAYAPDVLGPQDVPELALYDGGVADVVLKHHAPLFELIERVQRELPGFDAERVSASAAASTHHRALLTSAGLAHHGEGTSFGAYADADHRAYDVLSLRVLPTEAEVTRMIRRAGETNRLLRRDATLTPGRQPVLLAPSAAEAMLNKFLMTNLDAQRVLDGQSAFTEAQFREGAAIAPAGFGLAIDPLRPLSPGSYAISREGVPARAQALIEDGRLVTPLVDLKQAKRSGLRPTPIPRGGSSLRFSGAGEGFEALMAGMARGLVVYQLLGLHTQDSSRGNFSVTVAQGLVIENGQPLGRAKAIIAGNFFDALRNGMQLGREDGKDVPGLLFEADVTSG